MGQSALSCMRPAATPQLHASSPTAATPQLHASSPTADLSSVFKSSLKTRRARSSFIRSAPSSTRLVNRATSLSTDHSNKQYAPRTPANKAAMPSEAKVHESINDQTKADILEMNGLIVRERPSTDNLSISTSINADDDEAYCTSTRCTIIPNTTLQFTKVSPLSSENVSPRTVLAFLMTSNHSTDQSMDITDTQTLDKILREHQITQSIDHSTSQERDSDSETDDEEFYDYDHDAYYSYIAPTKSSRRQVYEKEVQQLDVVPTHHYAVRQPREQRVYRRNSC